MDTAINIFEEVDLQQQEWFEELMLQSASGYFNIMTIDLSDRLGL